MNQQHYFQPQRTQDAEHLGSAHAPKAHATKHPHQPGIVAEPSHEEVAERAYLIYLKEGCPQGRALEHWLAAENQTIGV